MTIYNNVWPDNYAPHTQRPIIPGVPTPPFIPIVPTPHACKRRITTPCSCKRREPISHTCKQRKPAPHTHKPIIPCVPVPHTHKPIIPGVPTPHTHKPIIPGVPTPHTHKPIIPGVPTPHTEKPILTGVPTPHTHRPILTGVPSPYQPIIPGVPTPHTEKPILTGVPTPHTEKPIIPGVPTPDMIDTEDITNSPLQCHAIGAWKGNKDYDKWCYNNCKLGNCPPDTCKCNKNMDKKCSEHVYYKCYSNQGTLGMTPDCCKPYNTLDNYKWCNGEKCRYNCRGLIKDNICTEYHSIINEIPDEWCQNNSTTSCKKVYNQVCNPPIE